MSFCEIILVGRIGKEPSLRFTATGTAVCDFSLAVSRRRKQGGEWTEETTWFKVSVWGQLAETVNQYVEKGKQVLVVGDKIEARAYTPREGGDPRASLEITAKEVRFLGSRSDNATDTGEDEQPF